MEKSFEEQSEREKGLEELGKRMTERFNREKKTEEAAEILVKALVGQQEKKAKGGNNKFKSAIDKQIDGLRNRLNNAEENIGIIKKKGTKEQIEERQKQIEFLKEEMKKAENAKNLEVEKSKIKKFREINEIEKTGSSELTENTAP